MLHPRVHDARVAVDLVEGDRGGRGKQLHLLPAALPLSGNPTQFPAAGAAVVRKEPQRERKQVSLAAPLRWPG